MVISTRTPEGEPLQCDVCGHEHFVLASWPPGDSVCPACGSHSWLATAKIEEQFPTPEVLRRIPTIVDRIRLCGSTSEMGIHLTNGLFECLSPYGVMLWLSNPSAGGEGIQFDLAASKGETHSQEFAVTVAEHRRDMMQIAKTSNGERLLIGVPLQTARESPVAGILEVSQRVRTPSDTRDGILGFVRTMAAVSAGSRVFTSERIE